MSDLQELYQEIILTHNRRPRNYRPVAGCTHRAHGHNPLCGDEVTVELRVEDGRLVDVGFQGEGCAISRASASILTESLRDLAPAEARERIRETLRTLTDTSLPLPDPIEGGELAALAGARRFPARVKCATLAWHAAESALSNAQA